MEDRLSDVESIAPLRQPVTTSERTAQRGRPPLTNFARWTMYALLWTTFGILIGVIEGLVKSGLLFIPPLLVGMLALVSAGLIATRIRWFLIIATVYALIMLLGAATLGFSSVIMRLTNPGNPFGFLETWIQMTGTLVAALAGSAAIIQWIRDVLSLRKQP